MGKRLCREDRSWIGFERPVAQVFQVKILGALGTVCLLVADMVMHFFMQ